MSPEELRAKAAWLYDLTGSECPWRIATAHDLHEWALNIEDSCNADLTGAESRLVRDLIARLDEELDSPEERARKARREKKKLKDHPNDFPAGDPNAIEAFCKHIISKLEQPKAFHLKGAAARKQQGALTRDEIIKRYQSSTMPERERAGAIAKTLETSPQHVRRVLKKEKLK